MKELQSKKYKLDKKDLAKVGKGALIAIGGGAVVYGLNVLPLIEFGQYTPLVMVLIMPLLNIARKWFAGKK